MEVLLWIGAILLIPLFVAVADQLGKKLTGRDDEWMRKENLPRELIDARLFLNEKDVSIKRPVPIHGRVDQVFLLREPKQLVPVDTKTRSRHRVYESDRIQLSAYALMLAKSYRRYPVAPYGFVRTVVVSGGGHESVQYIRVELLTEDRVIALWRRHRYLKERRIKAECTCGGSFHN